ncbi:PilZ domain-containing protein [bacterium]|nr:PilZ domain-containing protein [bacterium]
MDDCIFTADTFVERRRHPRIPLKIIVNYRKVAESGNSNYKKSQSLNLGIGGIVIRSDQEMPVGELIVVELFLPPEDKRQNLAFLATCPEMECRKVSIQSKIAWSSFFEDEKYIFGVEFLNMSNEDSEYLKSFMEEYKIPESKAAVDE